MAATKLPFRGMLRAKFSLARMRKASLSGGRLMPKRAESSASCSLEPAGRLPVMISSRIRRTALSVTPLMSMDGLLAMSFVYCRQ